MNWIDNIYAMTFAASLMIGVIHFFIWLKQTRLSGHLLFSGIAISVASLAILEMYMMHAATPGHYATLLRWSHVPITTFILCILWFVRLDLGAGRYWLLMTGAGLRLVALCANFLSGDNVHYLELTGLHRIETLFGQTVPVPVGVRNPWMIVGQSSNFFILWYLLDAMVSAWRSKQGPKRRQTLLVCGSLCLCVITASLLAVAVVLGKLQSPFILSPTFFPVVLVMSYLLGGDVVNTLRISQELLRSQKKLGASEQRMEQTTTAANVGLWTWNLDEDVSWFSEIGTQLLGLPPGTQVSREAFLGMINEEDRQAILDARDEAVHGSGKYSAEYRIRTADGRTRWIAARGRAEREDAQAPHFLRGVLVDITERRQAEERLKLVVDGSPIGKLVCNSSGQITLANLRTEQMFGYPHDELLGQSVDVLLPHALRMQHARDRSAFLDAPRARPMAEAGEPFGLHKDGSLVPVEIALAPIEMNDSPHVLVSITDITERKRMERESALQRAELAHLSRVTLLGELARSLAHELNQPLTAVLSNAQAALRFLDHDPPNLGEVRDGLLHIVESDKRASEVIRRLRAMLRKEKLDYDALLINEVAQDTLRLINSDMLNRGITVSTDLAPDLPPVSGDRVQLQQVLLNLLINGSDAMRDVSGAKVLVVRTRMAPGPAVEVTISDIGHGIPDEALERIFNPFITTKAEGIGLGLAICRTIVQSHRGKLWATNNEGAGSTLHFTLPVTTDALSER
mgnify:CR=1 FL=1